MNMTEWRQPRTSRELVGPITVTSPAGPVTTFQVSIVRDGQQPVETDWKAQSTPGHARVGMGANAATEWPLPPGSYQLRVRYTSGADAPVVEDFARVVIT